MGAKWFTFKSSCNKLTSHAKIREENKLSFFFNYKEKRGTTLPNQRSCVTKLLIKKKQKYMNVPLNFILDWHCFIFGYFFSVSFGFIYHAKMCTNVNNLLWLLTDLFLEREKYLLLLIFFVSFVRFVCSKRHTYTCCFRNQPKVSCFKTAIK